MTESVQHTALDTLYSDFQMPRLGTPLKPNEAMEIAWQIAWQGTGRVGINPLVGAVAVDKDHRFISAGFHQQLGGAHAEAHLIDSIHKKNLQHKLNGASVYVTLEPCGHYGRTPPCALILSKLPILKVIYGLPDNTTKTAGKGIHLLKENCIQVMQYNDHDIKKKLALLSTHFEWFDKYRKPFVGIKIAGTLNNVIANKHSKRLWITSPRSRQYGHWLRLWYDAILIGKQTLILDNPTLNIRTLKNKRTPLRVVLDPNGQGLLSRSLKTHNLIKVEPEKTLWCCLDQFWQKSPSSLLKELDVLNVQHLVLQSNSTNTYLEQIINFLGKQEITSLLVEGGAKTWGHFINSQLAKRAHLFYALNVQFGDKKQLWTESLNQSFNLNPFNMTMLEEDMLIEGNLRYE